jgi:hypothetical protein
MLIQGVSFMYRRWISRAALLALMLVMPTLARAEEKKAAKSTKPGVVLRLASLDDLLAQGQFLAEAAGQGEKAKQAAAMLKNMAGEKGLEGIDTKKPMGAYGWIGPMGLDSQLILLVPIADEKAFLDLLDRLSVKAEKGDDGVYTASHEKVQVPIFFRFANQYVYVTAQDKDPIAKDKLLAPAAVLPADQVGTMSLTVDIDQIPDNLKNLALGNIDLRLANLKDKEVPNATEAQKKFHAAAIDDLGARIKSLLKDGGETTVRLDVDRKKADLSLSLQVAGKDGTPLAATIKDLGQVNSVAAALIGSNSVTNGMLNVSLPANLRKLVPTLIAEGEKQLAKEKDPLKRDVLTSLFKSFAPTLKSAELDVAVDLRGPGEGGLYTGIFGIKVKDGAGIDKTLRKIVGDLPEEARKFVAFDADKVGQTGIHKVTPERLDDNFMKLFGDNPIYFAVRDDAVLVALGDKGLSALKEALAATAKAGKVMEVRLALSQLAPLLAKDNKSAPAIAKEVFAKDKNSDKIHVSVEGGKALKVRLAMKAKLVEFFAKLEEAKKNNN